MYFELQLSAGVFTRIIRNRLKALPLCVDREFTDEGGNRLVVDQVVIGDGTWIQREQTIEMVNGLPQPRDIATQGVWIFSLQNYTNYTVPFLQVKQEVIIHVVKSSDLDANGPDATAPFKTLTIYPVFNVALTRSGTIGQGGPLTLSYTLAHVDFAALFLVLSAQQRNELQQFIAGVQLPPTTVDLGALTGLLGRPAAAINAGIAGGPDNSFVALRVDFDVLASPPALNRQFFEMGPTNLLAGKDWAMLTDYNLLLQDGTARARAALESESKIKLRSGPEARWEPGVPAIIVSAGVELLDACPFLVEDIDMDADVDILLSFSVPTPDTLRRHYFIKGRPSDSFEVFACAITGALLWPFIAPVMLEDEDAGLGVGYYFAGLAAGPYITFLGIFAAIETKTLEENISQNLGSTCHQVDDENYECDDKLNILMMLTPPHNSRLVLETARGVPEGLVLAGAVHNLRDFNRRNLTDVSAGAFTWRVVGGCRGGLGIGNRANIIVTAIPPAGMCKAYVLSDPAGEFTLETSVITGSEVVTITPHFKPEYTANPYPCRVRLITNRGVRTLTFAPPAAITEVESEKVNTLLHSTKKLCAKLKDKFNLPDKVERIDWWYDPHPDWQRTVQVWQIVVSGLRPQDTIRVARSDGLEVMSARPSGAGVTHMSMMFPGDRAPSGLSLELLGQQEESDEGRQMSVQQALFEHRASLPVHGPLRTMRFEGNAHNRRLFVVDADREMTWDVTVPMAPVLLSSVARAEDDAQDNIVVHTGKRVGAALTPNIRRALEQLSECAGSHEVVGSPRVGGIAETLYVRTERGARLYDISRPEEPREVCVYEQPAWFEGVALGGTLLAHHEPSTGLLDLYAITSNEIR